MSNYDLSTLIDIFAKFPALGPKSAKRIVLFIIKNRQNISNIVNNLEFLDKNLKTCRFCNNISTLDPCKICSDDSRKNIIMIVESLTELWKFEEIGFKGKYHVLGGLISMTLGKRPEDINIDNIKNRLYADKKDKNKFAISEIIISLSPSINGQTTSIYLVEELNKIGFINISHPSYGIPLGGNDLDYLDSATLKASISSRRSY